MKSSKNLGRLNGSKREVLSQALKETRAGVNVEANQDLIFERRVADEENSPLSDDSDEATESIQNSPTQPSQSIMAGSGLKRPLEAGPDGKPIIKKRKRNGPLSRPPPVIQDDGASWDGFSSEPDSERDSPTSEKSSPGADSELNSDELSSASEVSADDESEDDVDQEERKARSSAFKAWATSQVNEAIGFTPSAIDGSSNTGSKLPTPHSIRVQPRAPEIDPLPLELAMDSKVVDRKAFSVTVARSDEIQEARMELPILAEEQKIMEAIHNNPTVVICGETGSGKTTQVPQFLYEAGFGEKSGPYPGMVGITQPRRVAAVSMAARVGTELGEDHAKKIAHQIRFDSSVSQNTAVKFMTDGILIREIAKDLLLAKYSAVVIDEAHERSSNTDILIGLLSRIVDLRQAMSKEDSTVKPLKLVIMSATLRVQDFLDNKMLFRDGPPPLLQIQGRQFPVTMHFARRTQSDYLEQAFQRIFTGHRKLPPGGMLVFLTAQDEIATLSKRLKDVLGNLPGDELIIERDDQGSGSEEDPEEFDVEDQYPRPKTPRVHILPLYSQLETRDQLRVFEPPPAGSRMIVLATNVAETSLTIPGIRYVFDSGRAKEKRYDQVSGVQSFEVGWISKASASQRAGRAGRTGPGHCYRLYSSAIYERDFEEHAMPEVLRMPVEGIALQLKSMELHNVVNFPFPTPPDRQGLAKAERLLMYLGALSRDGKITPSGRGLSAFPLSPRYAKLLSVGHQYNCMAFTITLVAALATPNAFVPEHHLGAAKDTAQQTLTNEDRLAEEARLKRRSDYNHAHHTTSKLSRFSDGLKAFTALQGYLKAQSKDEYCGKTFLSPKSMSEASSLVEQLMSITGNVAPLHLSVSSPRDSTPSKDQIAALQQFIAAGFLDQIAILASLAPSPPYLGRNPKRAIEVPYLPLFPIKSSRPTEDTDIRDIAVYVHPSSVLAHLAVTDMPQYIIFSHLQRATPSTIEGAKKPRTRMHPLTTVTEKTILALARGTPLLEYGKPLSISDEKVGESGKQRTCIVQPNLVGEKGILGWPLTAQKVVQVRTARGEWVVE